MTVNMTVSYVYIIYIYVYIYIYIITRAQALFQYLIWSYHVSSRRHEECNLFDRFELWHASQQQCCSTALCPPDSLRRVSNFQVKQSRMHLRDFQSWDLESATVDKETCPGVLCCYASGSLITLITWRLIGMAISDKKHFFWFLRNETGWKECPLFETVITSVACSAIKKTTLCLRPLQPVMCTLLSTVRCIW